MLLPRLLTVARQARLPHCILLWPGLKFRSASATCVSSRSNPKQRGLQLVVGQLSPSRLRDQLWPPGRLGRSALPKHLEGTRLSLSEPSSTLTPMRSAQRNAIMASKCASSSASTSSAIRRLLELPPTNKQQTTSLESQHLPLWHRPDLQFLPHHCPTPEHKNRLSTHFHHRANCLLAPCLNRVIIAVAAAGGCVRITALKKRFVGRLNVPENTIKEVMARWRTKVKSCSHSLAGTQAWRLM